jgi:anhydro-N-acetylmuramic acid kinase
MLPLIDSSNRSAPEKLRTVYECIAIQLSTVLNALPGERILVTGGGAYNTFLLELLKKKTHKEIFLPEKKLIEFKEALIFAFLGVLRYLNLPNCLASVTGASRDNSGGIIHLIS